MNRLAVNWERANGPMTDGLTDGLTDGRTDGRTELDIEVHSHLISVLCFIVVLIHKLKS